MLSVEDTEDATKRGGWMLCIMEITLFIMEKSWKNHGILFLNFCGNPASENLVSWALCSLEFGRTEECST